MTRHNVAERPDVGCIGHDQALRANLTARWCPLAPISLVPNKPAKRVLRPPMAVRRVRLNANILSQLPAHPVGRLGSAIQPCVVGSPSDAETASIGSAASPHMACLTNF